MSIPRKVYLKSKVNWINSLSNNTVHLSFCHPWSASGEPSQLPRHCQVVDLKSKGSTKSECSTACDSPLPWVAPLCGTNGAKRHKRFRGHAGFASIRDTSLSLRSPIDHIAATSLHVEFTSEIHPDICSFPRIYISFAFTRIPPKPPLIFSMNQGGTCKNCITVDKPAHLEDTEGRRMRSTFARKWG